MSDPYSTHQKVLSGFPSVRRVLELGPGLYSTPLFLNPLFYPVLEELHSVEHNQIWADKISAEYKDPRWTMIVTPEPIEDYLKTIDISHFDFIFIDSSDYWENRVKTINYIGEVATNQTVVIHDFEHDFYQKAAHAFKNSIVDREQKPWTAVVWK